MLRIQFHPQRDDCGTVTESGASAVRGGVANHPAAVRQFSV